VRYIESFSADHPDIKTCRTLTLIAKCLMTLASHSTIEQNAKEPWMVRLNEFVQVGTQKHVFFLILEYLSFVEQCTSFYEFHQLCICKRYKETREYELMILYRWMMILVKMMAYYY
jgi:hypothetical protein